MSDICIGKYTGSQALCISHEDVLPQLASGCDGDDVRPEDPLSHDDRRRIQDLTRREPPSSQRPNGCGLL